MKFLRVILLAIFLIGIFPLGAFCNEAHQEAKTEHGHCILMCHSVCAHATVMEQKAVFTPVIPSTASLISTINLSYQNPSLDTLKRPPVVSA